MSIIILKYKTLYLLFKKQIHSTIHHTVTTQSKSPVKYFRELGQMPAKDLHIYSEVKLNISLAPKHWYSNIDMLCLTCSTYRMSKTWNCCKVNTQCNTCTNGMLWSSLKVSKRVDSDKKLELNINKKKKKSCFMLYALLFVGVLSALVILTLA